MFPEPLCLRMGVEVIGMLSLELLGGEFGTRRVFHLEIQLWVMLGWLHELWR